jgi:hypothetical protein
MSGARPSGFKQGGGFLNDVDGVITGYEFTDVFPGGDTRRQKKGDFRSLHFVLSARVDGAAEDVTTTLFAGSADDFEISENGKTITPVDDAGVRANSGLGKFIASMVEHGFPEEDLPEDEINFEPIIDQRVRFAQVVNEGATKKYGKRKAKVGKGEYDRTDLVVSAVYGEAETKRTGRSSSAGKPNGLLPKSSKKSTDDVAGLATSTLLDILAANDGELAKSKLPNKVTLALMKHPLREEVRRLIYSDEFLSMEAGWTYDQTSKTQLIELAK